MSRVRLLAIATLVAAACSGTKDKPGAALHGPAALAVFEGYVYHDDGSFRPYLAVANERGDELRLVDLTDSQVVESPGLAFPLSVPFVGRPMMVASADLHDGPTMPWALAVIEAGSTTIDLIDTWTGYPVVVARVPLAADGEVLALASAAVPDATTPTSPAAGRARLVVAMTGGRLEIVELSRGKAGAVVATRLVDGTGQTFVRGLPFDASSLSQGGDPGRIYAGSLDVNPGYGIASVALPRDLTGWSAATAGNVNWYPTGAPIQSVAAVGYSLWSFATDSFDAALSERVVAVPAPSSCMPAKAVCGMLLVNPSAGGLAAGWAPGETTLLPMALPAPVLGLAAAGRTAAALMPLTSAAGTKNTSAFAAVTAADGAIYFVDVARWAMVSETSTLVGAGQTRVSAASVVAGALPKTTSALGLWRLGGQSLTPVLSAAAADLPARIRVTPGFTPDDDWTLEWQGILPWLNQASATFTESGGTRTLSVRAGAGTFADLSSLHVRAGDLVEIGPVGSCTVSSEAQISGTAGTPVTGTTVTLVPPAGKAWTDLCVGGITGVTRDVAATFRALGLLLTGAKTGVAEPRPAKFVPSEFVKLPPPNQTQDSTTPTDYSLAANEFKTTAPVDRLFYVTDPCTSTATCDAAWKAAPHADVPDTGTTPRPTIVNSLTFPFPTGPMLGFSVGLVDPGCAAPKTAADCVATAPDPSRGAAIHFTTRSGVVPTGRRPIVDGRIVAADLPLGLALRDTGGSGVGVSVYASFTPGVLVLLSAGAATGTMAVLR